MTKVTATIDRVEREGDGFRVFWSYSDDTASQSEKFAAEQTKADVAAVIKMRLEAINAAYEKAESLQSFVGEVIEER